MLILEKQLTVTIANTLAGLILALCQEENGRANSAMYTCFHALNLARNSNISTLKMCKQSYLPFQACYAAQISAIPAHYERVELQKLRSLMKVNDQFSADLCF